MTRSSPSSCPTRSSCRSSSQPPECAATRPPAGPSRPRSRPATSCRFPSISIRASSSALTPAPANTWAGRIEASVVSPGSPYGDRSGFQVLELEECPVPELPGAAFPAERDHHVAFVVLDVDWGVWVGRWRTRAIAWSPSVARYSSEISSYFRPRCLPDIWETCFLVAWYSGDFE